MIISTGRRYVFVHIPKTGGSALALALEARAMKDDIMLGDTPKARRRRHRVASAQTRGRLWKHATLTDIDGLLPAGELEPLFAFTLVRNPWDRLVSYYHWLRMQRFDHAAVRLAAELDFTGFATHPQTVASLRAAPASTYMRRADGVEQCAAYIRIEHFAEDAAPLFDHLGFDLALPRVNASTRDTDYRRYYDVRTAESVGQSCAADIAVFGYRFE
jgi:sulfotransferase famil protein